jgi:hypothetical protein
MKTKPNKNNRSFFMKKIIYPVFFSLVILLAAACNKEENGQSNITVLMTDAPGNYTAVMIDIQRVEVTGDGGDAIILSTNAGIYNLLDFANGVNTIIATGDLLPGTISQIRLILGPNNTVTVDGVVHPLNTPSAEQSGLKIQVHRVFEPGVSYSILLDFDANQSVVELGNGGYNLKPVIRVIDQAISGSIKGSITPIGVIATVTAESDGISFTSVTNASGYFLVSGLPAGNYDLTVTPPLPLQPVIVADVNVITGVSTDVGLIAL